jgi:general secretion pathway protein L
MVLEFFAWWVEQLASLVPAPLRRAFAGPRQRLILRYAADMGEGAIEVRLRQAAGDGILGRFGTDARGLEALRTIANRIGAGVETILQVPSGLILEKMLVLPLAVQRDLARVVEYELDHETPFSPDELYWSVGVAARDRTAGQLTARLALVLRADVDPILHKLRGGGVKIAAISGDDHTAGIRLDRKTRLRHMIADPASLGWTPLLVALCVFLVMVAAVGPFVRQSLALSRAEARIDALQGDADAAAALRRQIGGSGGDLSDPQNVVGNPLLALAAVTDALPDDTYLSDFTMHHREVAIIGQSADAAALIQRLSDAPVLKDPGFSAPVTRDQGAANDSFAIRVGLRQP